MSSPLPPRHLADRFPRLRQSVHAVRLTLRLGCASLMVAAILTPQFAAAQQTEQAAARSYDIAPGPLTATLNQFAQESGAFLAGNASLTDGKQSGGLRGNYTISQGLAALLKGSGLAAVERSGGGWYLQTGVASGGGNDVLPAVEVRADSAGAAVPLYAGGQVARAAKVGLLGNKDFLDTPFNLSSITADTIRNQQARSIADVVLNDPSVRVVSPQTNGSEVFNIRGFAVNNQDVSFDGLYGILPYWRGSVTSAERVEILKGPNALLNGMAPSGAVGGAINIVPKRAEDSPVTDFTASYLSDSHVGGHLDLGRRFGPDNSFGIRLNAAYQDGKTSRTSQQLGEGALALDYRGRDVRVFADLGYQRLKLEGVEGLMSLAAGARVPSPPPADKSYYQQWTGWTNDTTYGVLRGEFDLTPELTLYGAVGGRRFNDDYLFPFGFGLNALGNFTEGFAYASSWYHTTSAETGLRGTLRTGPVGHKINLAATSFRQESGVVSGVAPTYASSIYTPTFVARPTLAPITSVPKTSEVELTSIALSDTLSFIDDTVQLTLGIRRQQVKVDNFSAVTGAATSRYDQSANTPSLGLVIKAAQGVSLYGNYVEGLSQGSTAPATAVNSGEVFAPFKSKQSELGTKIDFGRFATTVSLFQITRPSGITNPVTNVYGVDGEQRNRGVELNVFGEAAKGVRLLGGAMYLQAQQTRTAGATLDGKSAVNSPRLTLNLGSEWDTPFLQGLTLNTRVIYTGRAWVDAANTQEIPSWTRFDIGSRYHFQAGSVPVTLRANIENLFDRAYWMSSSLYRGNPRTLSLSAQMSF